MIEQPGVAVKECAVPSPGTELIDTLHPLNPKTVVGAPDSATVSLIEPVMVFSEATKFDAIGDPQPVTGSQPRPAE